MPAAMDPMVDTIPYIISHATLSGPPVLGRTEPEVIVSPKPSGPTVARAQMRKTTKKTSVMLHAKRKNFSRRCGRIHITGRLNTLKTI